MEKRFELVPEMTRLAPNGHTLYRIRALSDFLTVRKGHLGGWVEKEENISQNSAAWVYDDAMVYGDAWLRGFARVRGHAQVFDSAWLQDGAIVEDEAKVGGNAFLFDAARFKEDARASDNAWVGGRTVIHKKVWLCGDARICDERAIMVFTGLEKHNRPLTFFRAKDEEICVGCEGYLLGTLEEFSEDMARRYGDDKRVNSMYQVTINVARLRIKDSAIMQPKYLRTKEKGL